MYTPADKILGQQMCARARIRYKRAGYYITEKKEKNQREHFHFMLHFINDNIQKVLITRKNQFSINNVISDSLRDLLGIRSDEIYI